MPEVPMMEIPPTMPSLGLNVRRASSSPPRHGNRHLQSPAVQGRQFPHHHLPGNRIDGRLSHRQSQAGKGDFPHPSSLQETDAGLCGERHLGLYHAAVGHIGVIARIFHHGSRSRYVCFLTDGCKGQGQFLSVGYPKTYFRKRFTRQQANQGCLGRSRGTGSGGVSAPQGIEIGQQALDGFPQSVYAGHRNEIGRQGRATDCIDRNPQTAGRLQFSTKPPLSPLSLVRMAWGFNCSRSSVSGTPSW